MRRGARIVGFALVGCILASGAALLASSAGRETFDKASRASAVARWWRCRDVDRPLLAELDGTWILVYAWTVDGKHKTLTLRNDGIAALSRDIHYWEELIARVRITDADLSRIASAIDRAGLLCLSPKERAPIDAPERGRYTLEVATRDRADHVFGHVVICDESTTVDDPWAVYEVIDSILSLERHFGDRTAWDPGRTAGGYCYDVRR